MFGKLLKIYRERSGKTKTEIAELLGYSQPLISFIESGKRKAPTFDECVRLSSFLSLKNDEKSEFLKAARDSRYKEKDLLFFRSDDLQLVNTPLVKGTSELPVYEFPVAAGYAGTFDENNISEYKIWNKEADFVLRVTGRSMEPKIPDGSYIGIKRHIEPVTGKMMLIRYTDEFGNTNHTIKYVGQHDGKVELISANKEFTNIIPSDHVDVIGYVTDYWGIV